MNARLLFLFLLVPVACTPCKDSDGRKVQGPVIIGDLCHDGDDDSSSGSSSGSASSGPTDTTDTGSSSGEMCPAVGCDGDFCPSVACVNGECPGSSFCMIDGFCYITCPCQANPGECAAKPSGGEVWFCPEAAAPLCG